MENMPELAITALALNEKDLKLIIKKQGCFKLAFGLKIMGFSLKYLIIYDDISVLKLGMCIH